jgi:hypothetical protein
MYAGSWSIRRIPKELYSVHPGSKAEHDAANRICPFTPSIAWPRSPLKPVAPGLTGPGSLAAADLSGAVDLLLTLGSP